jgi:hypothetical protein
MANAIEADSVKVTVRPILDNLTVRFTIESPGTEMRTFRLSWGAAKALASLIDETATKVKWAEEGQHAP